MRPLRVLLACVFPLFVIVLVLSLSCPGWLLESVPVTVKDGLLRLRKAENSVLLPLGEGLRPDHPVLGRRRAVTTKKNLQVVLPYADISSQEKCKSSFYLWKTSMWLGSCMLERFGNYTIWETTLAND